MQVVHKSLFKLEKKLPACTVRSVIRQMQFLQMSGAIMQARKLPVASLAAQRRQSDAGGVEAAIYGENLPGDVAGAVAAQEKHRLRQFLLEAVAVERNGVVI